MRRALICGVSGQDGALLARNLLSKGYRVLGTSRDHRTCDFRRLDMLGIRDQIELCSMSIGDFRSAHSVIDNFRPNEIYNLAGQTSVGLSFEQPVEAMNSIVQGTLTLLEVMRSVKFDIKLYNAGSSESFGDVGNRPISESDGFSPKSPYAVAKTSASFLAKSYRDAYGIFAANGLLFNHESNLRPDHFVTKKVVMAAAAIKSGECDKLVIGDIGIARDWGWAEEYVEAMWLMLQEEAPGDYVVATGRSEPLAYFIKSAFEYFNLDWKNHLIFEKGLTRPSEIRHSRGDASKIFKVFGWRATVDIDGVIDRMCSYAALSCRTRRPASLPVI